MTRVRGKNREFPSFLFPKKNIHHRDNYRFTRVKPTGDPYNEIVLVNVNVVYRRQSAALRARNPPACHTLNEICTILL